MALNAYLYIKGQRSGEIKGSAGKKGRTGSIAVNAFEHEVSSPRDVQSGLPTGRRQHHVIRLTKEVDAASPLLWNMLCTNENCEEWELRFWQLSPGSTEQQFFTIVLGNASVASMRMVLPDNKQPELARLREREEITFAYQRIEWRHESDGATASDDWETRV